MSLRGCIIISSWGHYGGISIWDFIAIPEENKALRLYKMRVLKYYVENKALFETWKYGKRK